MACHNLSGESSFTKRNGFSSAFLMLTLFTVSRVLAMQGKC